MDRGKLQRPGEGEEVAENPSRGYGRPQPWSSSYRALRSAVSSLSRIEDFYCEKIGAGFFSEVFKVRHRQSGQIMVLKMNKLESNRGNMLREVQLMNRLSHPNILRFMGACVHQGQLHALVEYINGGNLEELLDSSVPLPWSLRVKLALDIAYGLCYLHSSDIFHRDLTSKNCLVRRETNGYTAVVGDFGLAEKIPVCRSVGSINHKDPLPVVGSPYWMAPEVLRAEFYNETADVFSYGIILCETIARIPADPDYMPRTEDYGLDVTAFCEMVETSCPTAFLALAFNCCNMEPTSRPSFVEITRCLEDVLRQQRCTEEARTTLSDAEESPLSPGTTDTISGIHSYSLSTPKSSTPKSSTLLLKPCSGASTKEATPRVNPFSHREDLKRGKIKIISTPNKSTLSLTSNLPSLATLQHSSSMTPESGIKVECDFSAPAASPLKCHLLPASLELPQGESLVQDVGSRHPSDDSQSSALLHSAAWGEVSVLSHGPEKQVDCGSDSGVLPSSSIELPGTTLSCTQLSATQHTPDLSSPCIATPEQTEHAAMLHGHSSTSALDKHEVLPCSYCHGTALGPSSNQPLSCEAESPLCHHQKVPRPVPAEPKPKLPEGQS
ncbi:TESK1 kinase, partial [Ramphastos sulfuratus]|nr:TESK1 kinase [Ramphastos sulfuratus]